MEQKTILSKIQRRFLEFVLKEPYLLRHYYWTGGTVLSEFYFQHRESHDIDLFSDQEIHLPGVSKFVGITGTHLGARKISHSRFLGLHSFIFHLPDENLKVDFNYYPFPRIEVGKKWKGLAIDSLLDITVNKIHTIALKPRARDYVDLFFILQSKKDLSIAQLIILAKAKFDWHIEPVQLGENFAKVVTFTDFPKMYVPFDRQKIVDFFLDLAKGMKKEIIA